ncbi:MAG: hypothetical protein ACOYS2_00395, partial [Patescibacteria group bacterium]
VSINKKKKPLQAPSRKASPSTPNVWSQKAFSQTKNKSVLENVREEILEKKKENQTTGHIYIKENEGLEEKLGKSSFDNLKAIISETQGKLQQFKSLLPKERSDKKIPEEPHAKWVVRINKPFQKLGRLSLSSRKKASQSFQKTKNAIRKIFHRFSFELPLKSSSPAVKKTLSWIVSPLKKLALIFRTLSTKGKLLALAILFLIFIFPLLVVFWNGNSSPQESAQEVATLKTSEEEAPSPQELSASQGSFEPLSSEVSLESILLSGDNLFGIRESSVYSIAEKKDFALEPTWGKIKDSALMEDLNLILLLTDQKKLVSFSPSSQKFQENKLILPEGSDFKILGTYLTYLYILDENQNQIYRYPRAEGGFGEKTDWLKETADLKNIADSAINENIFLLKDGTILKYWRGKKQDFPLEKPLKGDALSSFEESPLLFVLDKQDRSISILDNDGRLQERFPNQNLSSARKILVSPKNNREFFILLENGLLGKLSF